MKKYKLVILMASLVFIVSVLAGCSSINPVAEELAKQRAALTIGEFEGEHSITANGTELGSEESELFEVGSDVRLVVEPSEGYDFDGWKNIDHGDAQNINDITIVMTEENLTIRPEFSEVDVVEDIGAEGLTMVMETEPGDTVVGGNIEGPPAVIIENDEGPVGDVEVTVSLDAETSLGGTVVQTTDENGIATFDDLAINEIGNSYELVFDAEFADIPLRVVSEPFDVVEG
ncbi:MAG: InlB B-repeat-containing protein, partial [Bacillota bacterium]